MKDRSATPAADCGLAGSVRRNLPVLIGREC